MILRGKRNVGAVLLTAAAGAELGLIHLGQTYGSTPEERRITLPGDDIVPHPQVVTNHAITIDAPPEAVWPWFVQMGWHRAGWYTARWVDRLLFPANWPSANRIIPGLQEIHLGDFIPDGAPKTKCGFIVERLEPQRALALHSTSHLPASWRERSARPRLTGRGPLYSAQWTVPSGLASCSDQGGQRHHGGSPSVAGSSSFQLTF